MGRRKNKQWSLKHKCCVRCKTTTVKHWAHGLCKKCFNKYDYENRMKYVQKTEKFKEWRRNYEKQRRKNDKRFRDKSRERFKAWQKKNLGYCAVINYIYYHSNIEFRKKKLKYSKKRHIKNRTKHLEQMKKWYKKNKDYKLFYEWCLRSIK